MTARLVVLEVPFNSSGALDGVARMPQALGEAGLYDVVGGEMPAARTLVPFETPRAVRGMGGLLAEAALVSMIDNLSTAVQRALTADRWPLVIGGDCSVLLGVLRGAGAAGLLFIDGHEDAWPPHSTPTGEAADCELGIALGFHPGPNRLGQTGAFIDPEHVVVLGPRDRDELADASVASIADRVAFVSGDELAGGDVDVIAAGAVSRLRRRRGSWWLHVDLDVLATDALPAVDYQQSGGLTWAQLRRLMDAAMRQGGCIGASVVIYNPDLDGGVHARRIVEFLGQLISSIDRPPG